MLKKSTNNTFDKGLLMDFNPIVTPNNVLTNCLNGTIITFNGNEYALQNDMGNGRVETAYLPEGYIPLGTAELGGIIYIVSYNPLKGVCQIGSFPSPERNLTNDEFQEQITSLDISGFYKDKKDSYTYTDTIIKTQQRLILSDKFLYPGDKFQVSSINLLPDLNYISAYSNSENNSQYINPKYLKFSVISISEDGKIENLNDNLIWYPLQGESEESGTYYYIRNIQLGNTDEGKVDLDEYRSLVSSNYNIYQGNDKGNIGILAELECINTFSCGYNISQKINPSDDTKIRYSTKLYLNWTYDNPINSNKINLYGIKVRLYHDDDTLDRWQYIIIPCIYSVNGAINVGDFDICKYPNNVEFLNYNLNIPENLKYNLNKMGEFAVSTDQQEWIRQNQSWINNSMGWTGQASTPNSLKTLITQFFENNSKFIEQYLSPRQNNGEDSQIEIDLSSFNLSSEDIDRNPILHIEVTPLMPFGAIEYLKQSYQLDLNKVGTGKFTLNRYQYQNYSSGNIMNIGFETYPEENAEFRNLRVNVYEFTQDIYTRLVKEETNSHLYNDGSVFDNCNTILRLGTEYWANGNSELSGRVICNVINDEEPLYINENIGILPNSIQLNIPPEIFKSTSVAGEETVENNIDLSVVKISFDYVKDNITTTYSYYRLYYSNDLFNDVDLSECIDFKNLEIPILYTIKIDAQYKSFKRDDTATTYPSSNRYSLKKDNSIREYEVIYNAEYTFTKDVEFNTGSITYTCDPTFEATLKQGDIEDYTSYIYGDFENPTGTVPQLDINSTLTSNNVIFKLDTPIWSQYNRGSSIPSAGVFCPFDIGHACLNFWVDKHNVYIAFTPEWSDNLPEDFEQIPDETRGVSVVIEGKSYTDQDYTLSTTVLKQLLSDKDVLIIRGILYGDFNDIYDGTKLRIWNSDESIDGKTENISPGHNFTFIFLIAFLNQNNDVRIFSLCPGKAGDILTYNNKSVKVNGNAFSSQFRYDVDQNDADSRRWQSSFDLTDCIENIERIFLPYYKLDPSQTEPIDVYTASLFCYNNFIINYKEKMKVSLYNIKIKYKDINIETGLRINNLKYQTSLNDDMEVSTQIALPEIDYDDLLDPNLAVSLVKNILTNQVETSSYDATYLRYTEYNDTDGVWTLTPDYPSTIRLPKNPQLETEVTNSIEVADARVVGDETDKWMDTPLTGSIEQQNGRGYFRLGSYNTSDDTRILIYSELKVADSQGGTLFGIDKLDIFEQNE